MNRPLRRMALRIARAARRVRLVRDRRGTVMIEMAFCIPLMVLLGFGGIEMANLTLAHTRISQIGLATADNASRIAIGSNLSLPRIREIDINEVFTGAEEQASGLNFATNGRIILSSLERNEDDGQWIHWQRCYGNLDVESSFGDAGDGATGTDFPGMGPEGAEVTAPVGSAVMFVEIVYEYDAIAFGDWLGPRTIRSRAAFNIREGRDLSQVYPSTGVTPSTCT
ncbi:TadE/TadG family type IV pilus assembly protein [Sphingopyxis sp.]|uniref:TadE/TadG family type IV pilus assembly protein n=1 Tax=Sphingopyxis sp. TaxID=1908224 RepID=UPI002B49914E|nr:TadE/TadG family type IV pilus assembly protein [Sphingopyxis sp.]HJS10836.1 TadE/TadG family type IV pilus assembly protein [Sphingopyxis sp.]